MSSAKIVGSKNRTLEMKYRIKPHIFSKLKSTMYMKKLFQRYFHEKKYLS